MKTTLEARGAQTIDHLSSLEDTTHNTHGLGSDYQPADSGAERRTVPQRQDERNKTPTSDPQVEFTTLTNSVSPLTGEHAIFVGDTPHGAPIIKKPLALVFVMGNYTSTAFTVAAWVLVACTMLAVTIKACLWGRLKLRRDDNVPLQSSISIASYPP